MIGGFSACSGGSAGSDCEKKASQREQDVCYFDLLSKEEVDGLEGALEAAAAIEDSVIKSAGVLEWIAQNNRKVSPEEGQRLCDVLVNWEKTQCERRLYAAHLRR